MLLASASSLLEDVERRLRNAEIDVKTLRIVDKNREMFLKLHALLSDIEESPSNDVKTGTNKMSEVSGNRQETAGSMKLFLDMRIEELEAFGKERDAVFSFIGMCSVIKSGESQNIFSSRTGSRPFFSFYVKILRSPCAYFL